MKIDIAGVKVDDVTNAETLERIKEFVQSGQPHQIVTAYSEFVVEAQRNEKFRGAINRADLSVADGIGILWAAYFLSGPKRDDFTTTLNWLGSLASVILSPQSIRSVIKEQVTGRKLIWGIARIAAENNFSLALVGGEGDVAEKSAAGLRKQHPNLNINLAYSPGPFDDQAVSRIAQSNSDILLIAYQPPKQEIWLSENLQKLNVKVAIGLGGTFDYLAGKRPQAPDIFHRMGLEWFWRLITQPWRIARIWRATVKFSFLILQHKLK
jgi:N-acetylglucosaminyldiphosphoundecaprenol N-acetyl-beta-D-mannosaminyltransferase